MTNLSSWYLSIINAKHVNPKEITCVIQFQYDVSEISNYDVISIELIVYGTCSVLRYVLHLYSKHLP